jgi:hypothetical protein
MFVGHYAVALAAKQVAPRTSLAWGFIAVQFLDVLWVPLVLFGVERARVVPGFLPASPLDLYYMPCTHSLVMAAAWSWVFYRLSKVPILGLCVFSHWVLDLVAHVHDLPLMKGAPYLGFGLWRSRAGTFWTEAVLLGIGLAIYLHATRPKTWGGRIAMPVSVVALVAANAVNLYGPSPTNIRSVAIAAELSYLVFAGIAGWLDRMRAPAEAQESGAAPTGSTAT